MPRFLCKTTVYKCCSRTLSHTSKASFPGLRWFSVSSKDAQKLSFTISYLVNSLGFSHKEAVSFSKYIKFDSSEKPDKAIEFLKNYGFTHTQISRTVKRLPQLLLAKTEKSILPKLEFLESKGLSRAELAERLSLFPSVLSHNLDNQISPAYEFMRSFFRSDEKKTLALVKRHPNILAIKVEKCIGPNVDTLREHGVPYHNAANLVLKQPRCLIVDPGAFRKLVAGLLAMGFEASKLSFIVAVIAFRVMKRSTWESKVGAFEKWGWSKEEVLKAFEKELRCMLNSEEKISACMEFLTNEMGLRPRDVAKYPLIFSFSLEKRIMPRFLVYRALRSKGLLKEEIGISPLLCPSEKRFLERFVALYEKEAPELLELYKRKQRAFQGDRSLA